LLQDAIRAYHDLLTDDRAAEAQGRLEEAQRRRGVVAGDRPLCPVLRPHFLTPEQYRFLQARVRLLLPALDRAYRAALADPLFRPQFRLSGAEESLLRADPGLPCPCPTARLDGVFFSEQDLCFTAFHAETPAGAAYQDVLSDLFLGLPVVGDFLRRYQLRPLPARPGVLHALLAAYREWSGRREPPRVAVLDWRDAPTYSAGVLLADYFRRHGLECAVADPRTLEYRDGRLRAGAGDVTLAYRRVPVGELLERGGLNQPLVRAVRDGAACMVNPFRCTVLHKRASLAVLGDERNAHLFAPEEREAIAAHIPWTRCVEERSTVHGGETVDLVPFLLKHRERFALKPNEDRGDGGVVLGWTVDDGAWEGAVRQALAEPYVVQERVNLPTEPFPSAPDGRVRFSDYHLETSPFVCHGAYADACLTRVYPEERPEAPAEGGWPVPTFLVEERG
jgi:hypothetical protein